MDPAHLHLIITHLPIFGCFMGIVVLIYGLFSKSNTTIKAAYIIFILSSMGGAAAYLTGEAAEELVEHIRGIAPNNIKAHEESAEVTVIALAILGVVSFTSITFNSRLKKYSDQLPLFVLIVALVCFFMASRTAYLGGKIRHTEIGSNRRNLNTKLKPVPTDSIYLQFPKHLLYA